MTKILLSCNTDTYDIASDLKVDIEEALGFKVALDVEDADPADEADDPFQEEVTEAAVLLVFQFGDESISAWVMIEETDERAGGITYEESMFPEIINFSKSITRGIRILKYIMVNDFGLIVRSKDDNKPKTSAQHKQVEQPSKSSPAADPSCTIDQLIKDQQAYEATKAGKKGVFGKINKLFGKSKRRLSQQ